MVALKAALLLGLCLLCGSALARPASANGPRKEVVVPNGSATSNPPVLDAEAVLALRKQEGGAKGSSATGYWYKFVVKCSCRRGCWYDILYVDPYGRTISKSGTLRYRKSKTFKANADYYAFVNGKKFDPAYDNVRITC